MVGLDVLMVFSNRNVSRIPCYGSLIPLAGVNSSHISLRKRFSAAAVPVDETEKNLFTCILSSH